MQWNHPIRYAHILIMSFCVFLLCSLLSNAWAYVFNITPNETLPTTITAGSTIYVGYIIQNNTLSQRNNNFIKYLPPNVSITSGGCGPTFNLAPYGQSDDSCVLNLAITGAINGNDPDPHHHLFACFPGGLTCAGTAFPLNIAVVSQSTLVSITIAPIATSILNGESIQYTATGHFLDGTIQDLTFSAQWHSSNTSTVTIDNSGFATGISAGTAHITAVSGIITSNIALLTVLTPTLQSITISPTSATIDVHSDEQYTAIGHFSDSSTHDITNFVKWNSSATNVATINAHGQAIGVTAGTTNITASSNGIVSNTAVLTVNPATLLSISITPTSASIAVGNTQQYTATGLFSDSTTQDVTDTVSWHSSSTGVATINSTGLATGINVGTTNITASLDGITSNTATLTTTATLWAVNNSSLEAVLYCPVNADGSLGTCANTNASNIFARPTFMALNNSASTAYVVNSNVSATNAGSVSICPINANGTFGSCTTATTGLLDDPFGIALNPDNSFAYVTQLRQNTVLVCPISGGTLSTCSDTGGTGFNAPYSIAINNEDTIAFITNNKSNSVFRCNIIADDGTFANCVNTGASGLGSPEGIAFNSTGTMAWITNDKQPNNDIITCQVNASGFFSNCQKAIASKTFKSPAGIVLNATNSIAYIADFNTGIYSCPITANGTFSSCTQLNTVQDIVGLAMNN